MDLTLEVLWHRAAKLLQLSLESLASAPTLNMPAALMKGPIQFRSSSSPDFARPWDLGVLHLAALSSQRKTTRACATARPLAPTAS